MFALGYEGNQNTIVLILFWLLYEMWIIKKTVNTGYWYEMCHKAELIINVIYL